MHRATTLVIASLFAAIAGSAMADTSNGSQINNASSAITGTAGAGSLETNPSTGKSTDTGNGPSAGSGPKPGKSYDAGTRKQTGKAPGAGAGTGTGSTSGDTADGR